METLFARLCAPALAGIKASNLVAVDKEKYPCFQSEIRRLNEELGRKGIRFDVLCECPTRALVLVYRSACLEKTLRKHDAAQLLSSFGYSPADPTDAMLARLGSRITEHEFPHEIGVFLGYPLADVCGFLSDPRAGVLFVGEWKVYSDPDNAKKLFLRYAACRSAVIRRLNLGQSLSQIFCAA